MCGVFGIRSLERDIARITYFGLFALQHRGQESAGIAVSDRGRLTVLRDMGLVSQVFDEQNLSGLQGEAAIAEFGTGVPAKEFLAAIGGKALTKRMPLEREIRGYTVIDSVKAITGLGNDYLQIFGYTTERALIFTGVKYGRSPMIVIRTHPLKPAMVVYVRPQQVDELAVKLAELENVILARTELETRPLIERLERLT